MQEVQNLQTINISNGINLHLIKAPKFKTNTIALLIRRPLSRDESTYNALLPGILRNSSNQYDTLPKLNSALENMYGAVYDAQILKIGEEQILQFYIETPNIDDNLLFTALDFLKETLTNPLVEDEGFKNTTRQKEILQDKIKSRINDTGSYLKLKCIEITCKDEPFGIYADGYAEDLEAITPQKLYAHYKQLLATSPIELIIIGHIPNNIEEKIKHHTKDFSREAIINIPKTKQVYITEKPPTVHNENLNVSQGKICISIRVDSTNYYTLLLLNEILGGGPNSKLFINLRDKANLCYSVSSMSFRLKAMIMVQLGVDKNNFDKSIILIQKQMEQIAIGNVLDEEIDKAKNALTGNFRVMQDNKGQIINFYIQNFLAGNKDSTDEAIKAIENVTKEEIIQLGKSMYIDTICTL